MLMRAELSKRETRSEASSKVVRVDIRESGLPRDLVVAHIIAEIDVEIRGIAFCRFE
jgi:hypothetical protein